MAKPTAKPGEKAPQSGQYSANGGKTEVTLVKGEKVPPTAKPGQHYTLVDRTKHAKK